MRLDREISDEDAIFIEAVESLSVEILNNNEGRVAYSLAEAEAEGILKDEREKRGLNASLN